ncbi:hypothetical protein [Brevundimonas sp.]|uniref:hypothetical protein n=1 Tax=Brevundimonas sp. TaxID=1871086 RepID=UPI0028A2B09C|nr:hypothetical protein [Brevundimonas sp.]
MRKVNKVAAVLLLGAMATATAAQASVRYLAYDADNRITQSLTRGITLEVERGMFGATRVKGLFSTSSRGSARFESDNPSGLGNVLPAENRLGNGYKILPEGDGRALANALCPGSQTTWLVTGRVRSGHPLKVQAVGLWQDGQYRHCVELSYRYRGEWASLPTTLGEGPSDR